MLLWTIGVGLLLILWLFRINKDYHILSFFTKRVKTIDGSSLELTAPLAQGRTLFGNSFDGFGLDNVGLFTFARTMAEKYKQSYIQYGFGITIYNIITAEDAELVWNDASLITKGFVYKFLHPFLRTGLLTSTDKKWHSRRKMLTGTFHFNILGKFEEVFKEESQKFVKLIESQSTNAVSVSELIPTFTLNSICETALGVTLDEHLNGIQYRSSFKMIEECFVLRAFTNPFYGFDTIFQLFAGSKYSPHLKTVHEFSSEIIKKRRQLFDEEMRKNANDTNNADRNVDDFVFTKKRYAMLDTLLHAEKDGLIDHIGICEEVDTFMFEGFDTTSMGLIFSLMNLSLYPEIQQRCYDEIMENIDDLSLLDVAQINKLKYLECFVKETMRLYPSVPTITREATKETKLANNIILPAGSQISIHIFDIQRNPKYFSNPNAFDPDRFSTENSANRHPYAFTPFSAGQRNCIGQKFAMLEMKTLLVYVLKNFKLLPLIDPKEFAFEAGIIIRTKNNVKVKFVKRN